MLREWDGSWLDSRQQFEREVATRSGSVVAVVRTGACWNGDGGVVVVGGADGDGYYGHCDGSFVATGDENDGETLHCRPILSNFVATIGLDLWSGVRIWPQRL